MQSLPIDLLSLQCFLAAARTLKFSEAARTEHMSPGALGQRIAKLEDDLGGKLFERTTRRMVLTPLGERAIPLGQSLLDQAAELRSKLGSEGAAPYRLVIGTRFELGLSWLTPALTGLEQSRPERSLDLSFGDNAELLQRLQSYQVDALISSTRTLPNDSNYATLHGEAYVIVASPERLQRHPFDTPEDASNHLLLDIAADRPLFRYLLDAQLDDPLAPSEWSFVSMQFLGTIGAIRIRTLSGHGVAVLPEYYVRDDLAEGRLVRVLPELKLQSDAFRLVWLKDHPHAEQLKQLATELSGIPLR